MIGPVQFLYAFNTDDISTGTADIGPHTVQVRSQIDDFRFFCRVFQYRAAFRKGSCHQYVFGCADTGEIQIYLGSFQAVFYAGFDISVFQVDDRSHGFKGLQVQVNRPGTDGTAPGQRNFSMTFACQQRSHDEKRSAHTAHKVVRG